MYGLAVKNECGGFGTPSPSVSLFVSMNNAFLMRARKDSLAQELNVCSNFGHLDILAKNIMKISSERQRYRIRKAAANTQKGCSFACLAFGKASVYRVGTNLSILMNLLIDNRFSQFYRSISVPEFVGFAPFINHKHL